jgi:hypothetical protein
MKKSTIGAMLLALLLGSFALAYGVGEASAQLSSREPRAALVQENPTPSPTPATSSERIPTVKPTPTAAPRRKPTPSRSRSRRCTPGRPARAADLR